MSTAPSPLRTELVIPSSPDYLPLVRQSVRWFCERCGLPEDEGGRVALAVVEAVTNIIRHAYQGRPDERITLFFSELPGGIEIEFLDEGTSVPPEALRGRDLDDVEPGGLGLHIMKCCMDSFDYEARPGGGSRLVLKKFAPAVPADKADPKQGK